MSPPTRCSVSHPIVSPGRLLPALLPALFLLWPTAVTTLAANRVAVNDTTITITVPIDIDEATVEGNADYYRRLWTAAIDVWWNRQGNHFTITCADGSKLRTVVFVPDIQVRSGETGFREDAHQIAALPGESSLPGYEPRADVHTPGVIYDPLEEITHGHWPEEKRPGSIAHEFGHIVGLPDEYETYRTPEGRLQSRPTPGYADSIMSDLGDVQQRHIDEVVRQHTTPEQLDCPDPHSTSGPGGGPSGGPGEGSATDNGAAPPSAGDCLATDVTGTFTTHASDMDGRQAGCTVQILGCPGGMMELKASFNWQAGERCPFFEQSRMITFFSERIPVCCPVIRACLDTEGCDVRNLLGPPRPRSMQETVAQQLMTNVFTSLVELPSVPPCLAAYVSPRSLGSTPTS